jgi:hypothetical protein
MRFVGEGDGDGLADRPGWTEPSPPPIRCEGSSPRPNHRTETTITAINAPARMILRFGLARPVSGSSIGCTAEL